MIIINQQRVKPSDLYPYISNKEQRTIIEYMEKYRGSYSYFTLDQLKFELKFRTNTMNAARYVQNSGAKFTTFRYAFCNKQYWNRLSNGGFLIKPNIKPSVAILDIIKNGTLYAFECSTAVAIALYIATLYSIGSSRFDILFQNLYLMDWQFDEDMQMYQKIGDDYIPGDILHFNNPDFNPEEPHWRAENVVYFGNDLYWGHGIGIKDSSTIINFLNDKRKQKSQTSAYLMRLITRPYYQSFR